MAAFGNTAKRLSNIFKRTRGNNNNSGTSRAAERGFTRLFINLGRMDGIRPADSKKVVKGLKNINFLGRRVAVEVAQETPSEDRRKKIEKSNQYRGSGSAGGGRKKFQGKSRRR